MFWAGAAMHRLFLSAITPQALPFGALMIKPHAPNMENAREAFSR
jgi:hypothetical protein